MSHRSALLNTALGIAQLTLAFGRVERVTRHEDGLRPETDTDHTVMLGVAACAFAAKFQPNLNLGLIAQFAITHDLVEAYAGDTVTSAGLTEEEQRNKEAREEAALKCIEEQFGETLPWIGATIRAYEALELPEARYIKVFDKIMPKLTHILNGAVVLARISYDLYHTEQRKLIHELAWEWPWLIELWEQSVTETRLVAEEAEFPMVRGR